MTIQTASINEPEQVVVSAMQDALKLESVVRDVCVYKTSKLVTGHKVLDDARAVQALIEAAPEHLRKAIRAQNIKLYRLTQLLNYVLSRKP